MGHISVRTPLPNASMSTKRLPSLLLFSTEKFEFIDIWWNNRSNNTFWNTKSSSATLSLSFFAVIMLIRNGIHALLFRFTQIPIVSFVYRNNFSICFMMANVELLCASRSICKRLKKGRVWNACSHCNRRKTTSNFTFFLCFRIPGKIKIICSTAIFVLATLFSCFL